MVRTLSFQVFDDLFEAVPLFAFSILFFTSREDMQSAMSRSFVETIIFAYFAGIDIGQIGIDIIEHRAVRKSKCTYIGNRFGDGQTLQLTAFAKCTSTDACH